MTSMRIICIGAALAFVIIVGLLAWSTARPNGAKAFFGSAPGGATLQFLGSPTNYLKFDHEHNWKAFAVSNGTSKLMVFGASGIDQRTAAGWLSESATTASLVTRRENPGELPPGGSAIFYASLPASSLPWRLRIGCFESSWHDLLKTAVRNFERKLRGLGPSNSRSFSGRKYELISSEVRP
jgi:hypothetical protein